MGRDGSSAAVARHARTHDLAHNKVARHVVQFLGHIFAKLAQLAAAIVAGLAGRQDGLLALEMLG